MRNFLVVMMMSASLALLGACGESEAGGSGTVSDAGPVSCQPGNTGDPCPDLMALCECCPDMLQQINCRAIAVNNPDELCQSALDNDDIQAACVR